MEKTLTVHFRNTTGSIDFDIPNKCPHCGGTMAPVFHDAYSPDKYENGHLKIGLLMQCTYGDCAKFYALQYSTTRSSINVSPYSVNSTPKLINFSYRPPISVNLPEGVESVSPTFVEIYSQATVAETEKLDLIAGVGYRKSVEFLVKDYAIRYFPDDKEKIEKMMLGPVIKEYLAEFKKLQNLATAATWIGNDETHYVRRHDDQDIQSMKRFIRAAAQYIAAEYDAEVAGEFTSN